MNDVIDLLVPADRQRLSTGFARLHRTARMPDRAVSSGPVRLAPMPRAVADTARQFTELRNVRAVVAEAVQRGRCTISELSGELRDGPIRGSAKFRSVLAEVADGIRSTAEGDLCDLIATARLPMPLFNPSLYAGDVFLGKPDAWWPDAGVAAEADSREWHLSPADWDRTRRRHQLMGAAGIISLHFSPARSAATPPWWHSASARPSRAASPAPLSPSAPSPARPPSQATYECGNLHISMCRLQQPYPPAQSKPGPDMSKVSYLGPRAPQPGMPAPPTNTPAPSVPPASSATRNYHVRPDLVGFG